MTQRGGFVTLRPLTLREKTSIASSEMQLSEKASHSGEEEKSFRFLYSIVPEAKHHIVKVKVAVLELQSTGGCAE